MDGRFGPAEQIGKIQVGKKRESWNKRNKHIRITNRVSYATL